MIANQKSFYNIRLLTDILIIVVSFLLAAMLAQSIELLFERNYMFVLLLIQILLWLPFAGVFKIYDEFRLINLFFSLVNYAKLTLLLALISILFIFSIRELLFTRNFILYFSAFLILNLLVKNILLNYLINRFRTRKKYLIKTIIVGSSKITSDFCNKLISNPKLGFDIIGFVNDHEPESEIAKYLGSYSMFSNLCSKYKPDAVVITLDSINIDRTKDIIRICDINAIKYFLLPDYSNIFSNKFDINFLDDFLILNYRKNPLEELQYRLFKRAFDIVFSLIFLLIFSWWLFPLLIFLIKIDSKGSACFIQERVGKNNKFFKCLKFRSMVIDENPQIISDDGIEKNGNRVTRIGKFLRSSNLDETPQFINILFGSMSIVGPRPHAIEFNEAYSDMVDIIKLRHRIKPGLTGWAQIHGLRGDVQDVNLNKVRTKKRIDYDIWYIENWSLILDVQIIAKTIYQIIRRVNPGT